MLRIHASLAAAVDGSSEEANATKTARATDARFIGTSFRHQRESCGAGEDRKRRLYADASTSVADLLPSVSPVTTVTVPSKRRQNAWSPCPVTFRTTTISSWQAKKFSFSSS